LGQGLDPVHERPAPATGDQEDQAEHAEQRRQDQVGAAVDASGRQRTGGAFVEDVLALRDVSVTAAVRYDGWRKGPAGYDRTSLSRKTLLLSCIY